MTHETKKQPTEPHLRCFSLLVDRHEELFESEPKIDVLAAIIGAGMYAQTFVTPEIQQEIADKVGDLVRRQALAQAVYEAEPKGNA